MIQWFAYSLTNGGHKPFYFLTLFCTSLMFCIFLILHDKPCHIFPKTLHMLESNFMSFLCNGYNVPMPFIVTKAKLCV